MALIMTLVENDRSDTIKYGNNNISFIGTTCVIVIHRIYNYVALLTALDIISSSSEQSFVRLSSEATPVPSLSSNIYRLSSDCGLACLEHDPIALVASLETISSLSSLYLSPVLKFLFS